jgi:hypothetical protein
VLKESKPGPWIPAGIPKERKIDLANRFGFDSSQLKVYERLSELMKTLNNKEKTNLVSYLLNK